MADWEWRLLSEGGTKEITFEAAAPGNSTDYGGIAPYDTREPPDIRRYGADRAPESIATEVRTAYFLRNGTYTVEPKFGEAFTGRVTGYQISYTDGAAWYDVEVELTKIITEIGGS